MVNIASRSNMKIILILLVTLWSTGCTTGLPVQEKQSQKAVAKKSPLISDDAKISPENQPPVFPPLSEMVEIKEEDIPDGTWVLEVEEPIQNQLVGETMDTASNVVFRPLFRYRERQSQRRNSSRNRRRYYVPRRSYRRTGSYYRPYRSAHSYYNPYNYYRYY